MPSPTIVAVGPVQFAWARTATDRRATSSALLRRLLVAASLDDVTYRECPHCGSTDHGRLLTASGLAVVSVSYADDLAVAAIALASDAASIGVDVEADRGSQPLLELTALFAPSAPPTIREWTAIEAVVKADGRGLRIAPGEVRAERSSARLPDGERFDVLDLPAPTGYVISAAIRRQTAG